MGSMSDHESEMAEDRDAKQSAMLGIVVVEEEGNGIPIAQPNVPHRTGLTRQHLSSHVQRSSSIHARITPRPPVLPMKPMSAPHVCEQCGKTYKHRNCLSKHRWEHHDAWELTKRICTTKHQQVQLLEAAQVLLEMQMIWRQQQAQIQMQQVSVQYQLPYSTASHGMSSTLHHRLSGPLKQPGHVAQLKRLEGSHNNSGRGDGGRATN